MLAGHVYYLPLSPLFFLILVSAAIALIALIQIGALTYAYHRLGVSSGAAMLLLVGAVNVGGAVIPGLLSLYLLAKNNLWVRGGIATAIVAVVCHMVAEPVPGVGIAEPIFTPPIASAVTSLVLSRRYAAPLAFVSGSLGALIGADLSNLDKIQGLGAPIASIGGTGAYDGIFVTGILAAPIARVHRP